MLSRSADDLSHLLVRLRVLTSQQADDCLAEIGSRHADQEELLQVLERRNLLTPYQTGQLRRNETDTLVLGGYKLLYRNASGSFARVFRAASIDDGRMVGVKVLRQRWAKDPQVVSQFHREAELCKRLRHKNIVPIYEVGRQGDNHYFTMEFVEGGNLRDFITIRKKLSPEEATQCVLDMAEGLEYALRMGITHRDLKLTNVLMGTDGVAKLVDFGLAGNNGAPAFRDDEVEQRALEYAAIEKATGAPDNDPRSDLFFLGAIYYELLTGTPPYPRTRDREERKRIGRYEHVRPLRSVEPSVPDRIAEIVERLMAISPSNRYQTPTELIRDLRTVLHELNPEAASPAAGNGDPGQSPVVLCIEDRADNQNTLRRYLTKHGFRVLLTGDLQRAMNRLRTNPPDAVILMGECIGNDVVSAYQQVIQISRQCPLTGVVVLSARQVHLQRDCPPTGSTRVLLQPVTVRELRRELQQLLRSRREGLETLIDLDDGPEDSAVARI
jgi:eukaryotic-like serine/threonine-protein kinase